MRSRDGVASRPSRCHPGRAMAHPRGMGSIAWATGVNRILYTMSVTQARYFAPGQQFPARKRAEGKTAKEARRAHMRQLAKRVIRRMWADQRRQRTAQTSTEAIALAVA